MEVWAQEFRKDFNELERVQRRAARMLKSLESGTCGHQQKDPEWTRLRVAMRADSKPLTGLCHTEKGMIPSAQAQRVEPELRGKNYKEAN